MKLGGLVLFGSVFFCICGCNNKNPSIKEEIINVEEAYSFINHKYKNNVGIIPSLDSIVSWNIELDNNNHAAIHINKYIVDPRLSDYVSTSKFG